MDGHEFDLLDWSEGLNSAFDPVVEKCAIREREEFVLFSKQFADAAEYSAVRETALVMIAAVNGAMAIRKGAGLVTLKGVADFSDGEPKIMISAEAHGALLRCRASFVGQMVDRHGKIIPPPPPEPSAAQDWIELSRQSDHVADLLTYAGRADNWFDVYKMIEAASVLAGSEPMLVKLCGTEVKAAKRRANEARHHRVAKKGEPLSFADTKAIAFRAADMVLSRAVK